MSLVQIRRVGSVGKRNGREESGREEATTLFGGSPPGHRSMVLLLRATNRWDVCSGGKDGWDARCHCRSMLALLHVHYCPAHCHPFRVDLLLCRFQSQFWPPVVVWFHIHSDTGDNAGCSVLCQLPRSGSARTRHRRRGRAEWVVLE